MTYDLTCETCSKEFTNYHSHTKTCSPDCRKIRAAKIAGKQAYVTGLPTATVGAIAEMAVALDLLRKGYAVFRALSSSCFCDLIAIKNEVIMRLEVRTGYYYSTTGTIQFPKQAHGPIDYFAIYLPALNEVRYFTPDFKQTGFFDPDIK